MTNSLNLEVIGFIDMIDKDTTKAPTVKTEKNVKKTKNIEIDDEEEKVKRKEDMFKSFDFLSKKQASYLIETLKQPVFYNRLPDPARRIIDVFSILISLVG